MHDPRAIANLILDAAQRHGLAVSNLKLQKLLYFVHGQYLIEQGEVLLSGEFEAWQFGPVHPLVYNAFKQFGADPITSRAETFDPLLRTWTPIDAVVDPPVVRYVDRVVATLGDLSPGRLVELTHIPGGAWHRTVDDASHSANIGLKIKNETIRRYFSKLGLVARRGEGGDEGEVREDTPYPRD